MNARRLVLYVAGPMTGIADFNAPLFHRVTAELRQRGFVVMNPTEINADLDAALPALLAHCTSDDEIKKLQADHWRACMRNDLKVLVDCDAIVMLPGWQQSRGARIEHQVATGLGMEAIDAAQLLPTVFARAA